MHNAQIRYERELELCADRRLFVETKWALVRFVIILVHRPYAMEIAVMVCNLLIFVFVVAHNTHCHSR